MRRDALFSLALLTVPAAPASAHSFGTIYTLPVPFWLYAWAASASLVLSFGAIAWLASAQAPAASAPGRPRPFPARPWRWLQGFSLLGFALCVATGLFGNVDPYANFNMTFFWILFLLGFAYAVALLGNAYPRLAPWRLLAEGLARLWPGLHQGRGGARLARLSARLGIVPALLLFMLLISVELFGDLGPRGLALALLIHLLLMLLGAALIGIEATARTLDPFGPFFALLGRLSPLAWSGTSPPVLGWRGWAGGLREPLPDERGWGLFLLAMLATTAYDGLHEAQPWVELFWLQLYPCCLQDWAGANPLLAYPRLRELYAVWQLAGLWLAPLLYAAVYALGIALVAWAGGAARAAPLRRAFLPSLLPIVLVYHITHYYTLIESQGVKIIALVSDPFGWGWNLFGTADWLQRSIVPDTAVVWHVQVGLILAGHVWSVVAAHHEALRQFDGAARATRSQLPMLALMVAFTVAGLWILAQPIKAV